MNPINILLNQYGLVNYIQEHIYWKPDVIGAMCVGCLIIRGNL